MNVSGKSELEKEVEDVKLLQESLQYQEDDPSQQQQALRALGEILCQNRRAQDYFCSTHGLEYVLSLSKSTKSSSLSQAALYTLAMATEGNDISQRALTKKSVFHMLRSNLQAKNSSATTSAFLLLTICADNSEGQNFARETKCLHGLCDLFKSCLPMYKMPSSVDNTDEKWFNNMDEDCIHLWNAVVTALQSLLQNPQNAQNQRICCRLLPMIVNMLQLAAKQKNIILPATTLLGAIVSGNDECQSKVRLLGGLRALINVLKQHINDKLATDEHLSFIEHVINAVGSATAGHVICRESAADLGLVSLLIKCLDMSQRSGVSPAVAKQFRTKCILALSICVDQCERHKQQLRQRGGVGLLVELLTHEQSEEFRRVAIFVLHCITENYQEEKRSDHKFEELELESCNQVDKQDIFIQAPSPTRKAKEAETQTDDICDTQTVCTEQRYRHTEVTAPTREAETQTDNHGTQTDCTGQSNRHPNLCVPTGEVIQEKSQNTREARQRRKRLSTMVLKPQAKSWNTQSTSETSAKKKALRKDATTATGPCMSVNQAQMKCVVCDSVLNSKNFLSTLRCSPKLCAYHRELNLFLRQKLN